MTLLAQRTNGATAPGPNSNPERISENQAGGLSVTGPLLTRQSLAADVPATDALLTLRTRLQTQLEASDGHDDPVDPVTRLILESARRRLEQVNTALSRIEEGIYGTCMACHKSIENERLVLLPFSIRCISCQTVAEWQGLSY